MTSIKLKTNRKDLPVHGLDKVPDEVIIEKLKVELGQANSYIDELEESLENIRKEYTASNVCKLENEVKSLKSSLNKMREENKIESYEKELKSKKKEIINLRQTISELVANNFKQ